MRLLRLLSMLCVSVLVLSSCGGSSDGDTTASSDDAALVDSDTTTDGPTEPVVEGERDDASLLLQVAPLAGPSIDDQMQFTECLTPVLDGETGDDVYLGITGLLQGAQLSGDTLSNTSETLQTCIEPRMISDQFAAIVEGQQGYNIEVDLDCAAEAFGETTFYASFWDSYLTSTPGPNAFAEAEALMTDCSTPFDLGLASALPGDWVEWSGQGALASVNPAVRDGAYSSPPPMTIDPAGSYEAIMTTSDGQIRIRLFAAESPITVNNFVNLARDGYYDQTIFHRVLAGFMAQGGDPSGTGSGGPGYSFGDEFDNGLEMDRRGLLAMANAGPATNGSQFFITFDAATHLTGAHTIFGEVIDGDDVVSLIDLRDPAAPNNRGERLISVEIIES